MLSTGPSLYAAPHCLPARPPAHHPRARAVAAFAPVHFAAPADRRPSHGHSRLYAWGTPPTSPQSIRDPRQPNQHCALSRVKGGSCGSDGSDRCVMVGSALAFSGEMRARPNMASPNMASASTESAPLPLTRKAASEAAAEAELAAKVAATAAAAVAAAVAAAEAEVAAMAAAAEAAAVFERQLSRTMAKIGPSRRPVSAKQARGVDSGASTSGSGSSSGSDGGSGGGSGGDTHQVAIGSGGGSGGGSVGDDGGGGDSSGGGGGGGGGSGGDHDKDHTSLDPMAVAPTSLDPFTSDLMGLDPPDAVRYSVRGLEDADMLVITHSLIKAGAGGHAIM